MIIFNNFRHKLIFSFLLISFIDVGNAEIKTYSEYHKILSFYNIAPPKKITQSVSKDALLNNRLNNFVYTTEDINLLQNYANQFLEISDFEKMEKLDSRKIYDYNSIFVKAIKQIQLPKDVLLLLRRYAISMQGLEFNKKYRLYGYLKNIIWWSVARTIDNSFELKAFLDKHMNTLRRKDAVLLYIEHGMVKELQKWKNKLNSKTSNKELSLAIRKVKFRLALLNNNTDSKSILIKEIETSIYDYLPIINEHKKNYEHLIWLIQQLGAFNKLTITKEILNNLAKDELYYNKEKIELLPPKKLEEFYKVFYSDREIYAKAIMASSPYDVIDLYPDRTKCRINLEELEK